MILLLLLSITSHDFSHMAVPAITSEIGFQVTDIVCDYLHTPDDCNRYAISIGIGIITTYFAFKYTAIRNHYITQQEHDLSGLGLSIWGGSRMVLGIIRMPLWHREAKKKIAYMEEIGG